MIEWKVPLAEPRLLESEIAELAEAYRSGWWAMGPRTASLEQDLRAYTGAPEAVAVSSCSAGLHLACLAAGIGPDDEVVLPSITFAATAHAVAWTGARVRFGEISGLREPWLSAGAVERALEGGATAVLAVSYGGHPGEIAGIASLCAEREVPLLEDAAHAAGSWSGGRHLGRHGLAGTLSFSAAKNLGVGEGGAVLCESPELADTVRSLRWHGITRSNLQRHSEAAAEYEVERPGFNYRIDDPRAALAAARLRRLDRDNETRGNLVAEYRAALVGEERLVPTAEAPSGERNSHCMFTAVLAESVDRRAFRSAMADRGVQTSVHFPPLHLSAAYAGTEAERLPLSEGYANRCVTLPLYPEMREEQLDLVIDAVRTSLRRSERRTAA
jgi:dTDP-4-amino-4,6-dideoxygalactose transaminase